MADNELLFCMNGAREVLDMTGGAARLEEQVKALEAAVVKTPSLAFDLSCSLVESVCKTILKDVGYTNCDSLGFKDLLQAVYKRIQIIPETHVESEDIKEAVYKIINSLNEVIWGLSELRHKAGVASHGRDAFEPPLDRLQAELVARAADAVISFLFKAHHSYLRPGESSRFEYGDYEDFDRWIDESNNPVRIFNLEYRPSEVLFHVDREAYRDFMMSYYNEE
ncbi:MAG: abortive infection family protein [Candidatus Caldarchaeum sp.]